MGSDREIDQVLMNVRNSTGGIISASLLSAKLSLMLITYLMRLAKKGLVAAGLANNFKEFTKNTEGNFSVYNIPLSAEKAQKIIQLNKLELKLEHTQKALEKRALRIEIKQLKAELPELEQLKLLKINHFVLPKLNGSDQTIQVAVDRKNDQQFKNWFINHLTTGLSGGEKEMEDLKVFTEGNVSIFNLPFEGEELTAALSDFKTLGMNYSILPDLNIGDGNSQIAIPNADRSKLEHWFKMWKDKQLKEGKEPGEMYVMNEESYINTSSIEPADYVAASDPEYQEANEEFEAQSTEVPWTAGIGKENSEEFVKLLNDQNYQKITINKSTLVDSMRGSAKAEEMRKNGYFISRIPKTYGDREETLILPENQVFKTDDGVTYIAFLPKNKNIMVANVSGNIAERSFKEVYKPYDNVKRGFKKVENLKKGLQPATNVDLKKMPVPPAPKL